MVSTKAFVHFIKQPSLPLEQIKTFDIHGLETTSHGQLADSHIRNKFHFSEVHRIMNVMGPVQSK